MEWLGRQGKGRRGGDLHLPSKPISVGRERVDREVRMSNIGAQELYRRFGFGPVGVRKNYYQEVNEDALVMWAHDVDTPEYANDPICKALNAAKSAPPSIEGKRVAATLANGRKVGDLELCTTTLEQAVAMFPPAPTPAYVGNPRPPQGYPPVTVGAVHHRPESVFNPWGSQYGLYFNSDKRLIIVQVLLSGATTIDYFTGKYPQLKETARTADAVEMQGAIDSCVAVMTLSAPTDGHVDQFAYACTCEAK